jgi:hypothetical protein
MYKALLAAFILFYTDISNEKSSQPRIYESLKAEVNLKRQVFKNAYDSADSESGRRSILTEAGRYLKAYLTDSIFPRWYNTPWDFNGYTDKPGEGQVACGYFVSTPLKHCGFNLNRFRLAQKYSFAIVKVISCGDSIKSFKGMKAKDFINRTKDSFKDGLYVVGLDFHVGFLLYEKGEVYFIHSNYREPVAVVKEKAIDSLALNDSQSFIVCNVTENEKLIKKWVMGSEIIIN